MNGWPELLQAMSRTGSAAPVPQAGQNPTTGLATLKVLVVEDEALIAWALQTQLEELGHEVVAIASSGYEAVTAATARLPDLVFMDINLGTGIDGIEAAALIQACSPIPVIFVTAYSDEATRARAASRVPESILLSKPVTTFQLEMAIGEVTREQE